MASEPSTLTIENANTYIELNVIDIDDWQDSDDNKKQRILNVADRTIRDKYSKELETITSFIIPDEAVFEFSAALSVIFNDQNKHMLNGVTQLSASGIASLMYKQGEVTTSGEYSLADFIPQSAISMINKANNITTTNKKLKWTVI